MSDTISEREYAGSETSFVLSPPKPALDPRDQRRIAVLQDIDNAKFSWYHVRTCLVAGVGFFADSYDIFAISIAVTMIAYSTGHTSGSLSRGADVGIKVATSVGTIFGQLVFGRLADLLGRKRMYGFELIIIIAGTFAQALCGQSRVTSLIGTLIVYRFLTGVGIGGDYPLSAVITSEFAATRVRGRMMTAVFSTQGWGTFTAALVSFIIVRAHFSSLDYLATDLQGDKTVLNAALTAADRCWRLLIGIGCIPSLIGLYFRLTIPESPRYTLDIERNIALAAQDVRLFYSTGRFTRREDAPLERVEAPDASLRGFLFHFSKWENGKILLGTSWSWFALDIAFYGLGLNSNNILQDIGFSGTHSIARNLSDLSKGNVILSMAGLIPGYIASVVFIDFLGRKPIQYMGFTMLTIILGCMGFGYDAMVNHGHYKGAFVFLYCLANFFGSFGANTTTFILPGEVFPTRYRATAYGVSAACGKFGSILAQVAFTFLSPSKTPKSPFNVLNIFELYALFTLTGIFSTMLIPETKGRTLEYLSNEDQETYIMNATQGRDEERGQ